MRKHFVPIIVALAFLCPVIMSCVTTPERTALTATETRIVTVDTAMEAWGDYVRAGYAEQYQVDAVKAAYQKYYLASLAEKQAWLAWVNSPTNATSTQVAVSIAKAAQRDLTTLIISFLPADKVSALNKP